VSRTTKRAPSTMTIVVSGDSCTLSIRSGLTANLLRFRRVTTIMSSILEDRPRREASATTAHPGPSLGTVGSLGHRVSRADPAGLRHPFRRLVPYGRFGCGDAAIRDQRRGLTSARGLLLGIPSAGWAHVVASDARKGPFGISG